MVSSGFSAKHICSVVSIYPFSRCVVSTQWVPTTVVATSAKSSWIHCRTQKLSSMLLLQLSRAQVFTWHPNLSDNNFATGFTTFRVWRVQLGKFNFATPGSYSLLASFHCIFSFKGASFPNDLTDMAVCQMSQTPCTTFQMIYRE